jgi:aspartate 1-decarboxylase
MRTLLHSLIENATVTRVGTALSLRIDAFVLRAAELLPFERVEVVNRARVVSLDANNRVITAG